MANDIANNYLEYEAGDKKFGELQSGDIIYMYMSNVENIIEITVKGKILKGINKFYISTKSFKYSPTCLSSCQIEFGPTNCRRTGADDEGIVREYLPEKVKDSSICISFGENYAFGTNKETVLKYAKRDMNKSIQKVQNDMIRLQNEIKRLNKRLENIN